MSQEHPAPPSTDSPEIPLQPEPLPQRLLRFIEETQRLKASFPDKFGLESPEQISRIPKALRQINSWLGYFLNLIYPHFIVNLQQKSTKHIPQEPDVSPGDEGEQLTRLEREITKILKEENSKVQQARLFTYPHVVAPFLQMAAQLYEQEQDRLQNTPTPNTAKEIFEEILTNPHANAHDALSDVSAYLRFLGRGLLRVTRMVLESLWLRLRHTTDFAMPEWSPDPRDLLTLLEKQLARMWLLTSLDSLQLQAKGIQYPEDFNKILQGLALTPTAATAEATANASSNAATVITDYENFIFVEYPNGTRELYVAADLLPTNPNPPITSGATS